MKYEEYEEKINTILGNPDTAPAEIGAVLESLKTDLTALDTLTAESAEKDKRIKDLQETNLKLYLNQGSTEEKEEEEEEESGIDWDKIINDEKGDN